MQFVHLFDEWCNVRQKLNDYYSDVTNHQFGLPPQHLDEALAQLDQAKIGEIRLKEWYAKVLNNIRSGAADF